MILLCFVLRVGAEVLHVVEPTGEEPGELRCHLRKEEERD